MNKNGKQEIVVDFWFTEQDVEEGRAKNSGWQLTKPNEVIAWSSIRDGIKPVDNKYFEIFTVTPK